MAIRHTFMRGSATDVIVQPATGRPPSCSDHRRCWLRRHRGISGGTNTAEIYTPVVLIPAPVPPIITGAANAASNVSGAIAPGELIILTGHGLGSVQLVSAAPADGLYPSQLAGTTVLVNGLSARLIYTSATQVAAVVPDVIPEGTAQIAVTYQGQTSLPLSVPVAPLAPGIFTADSTGRGHAATVNQAGLFNAPIDWYDTITLFLTGAGRATSGSVVFYPDSTLQIAIPLTGGGLQRTAAGVTQINVPIPYGLDCDVPVTVQLGNVSSQPGVTIAMRICI